MLSENTRLILHHDAYCLIIISLQYIIYMVTAFYVCQCSIVFMQNMSDVFTGVQHRSSLALKFRSVTLFALRTRFHWFATRRQPDGCLSSERLERWLSDPPGLEENELFKPVWAPVVPSFRWDHGVGFGVWRLITFVSEVTCSPSPPILASPHTR